MLQGLYDMSYVSFVLQMKKRGVSEVPVDVEAGRVHGHGPWTWFF